MDGFARRRPGVRILKGPFVLAKARSGVCDYATAADCDNPRNSFSIWF